MKGFKKILSAAVSLAMVFGLAAASPVTARAEEKIGIPMEINGKCWLDLWAYGAYVEEGFVPKKDAQYSVSYELFIPFKALTEWNELGQFDPDDPENFIGKVCQQPKIKWVANDENGEREIQLYDFNEWHINHGSKGSKEDLWLDGLYTEETGSVHPSTVEGPGVVTLGLADDMVCLKVNSQKATSKELKYVSAATNWEAKSFDGEFTGTEDLRFGLAFSQWIGGDKVETVYLSYASVEMDGRIIWSAGLPTDDIAGCPMFSTGKKDSEGLVVFADKESPAVKFNTFALKLSKSKVKVAPKKSVTVKVVTTRTGDKVKVKTSDKKIATAKYSKGKLTITGKKAGTAKITVTANGTKKVIKVTVKK